MRAKTRRTLRLVAFITALSALFGLAMSFASGGQILAGIISGALIAIAISTVETVLQGPWAERLRRWPVAVLLLIRTALYAAIFFMMVHSAAAITLWSWDPILHPTRLVSNTSLLLSFAFAFAVNVMIMLSRLLGPRVLAALLTGRYHQPREEQRIVLFMDIRDSTRTAERLGDQQFHRFLNQVFWDVTDPVLEAGGEIYRYVGDEIIVTWPARPGILEAGCLACVFAAEDALARRRAHYVQEFGIEPRLRNAMHAGPLMVGEMGDIKREIVMLGDTMNTAARIEGACRTLQRDFVVSAAALAMCSVPDDIRAQSLGSVALRGKESGIELFAVTRANR
jgi:adenylate cyclase